MFCTTKCWNFEYKNCEHYISKSSLYFENIILKEKLEKAIDCLKNSSDEFDYIIIEKSLEILEKEV